LYVRWINRPDSHISDIEREGPSWYVRWKNRPDSYISDIERERPSL
jgi:hypothetical protein